MIAAVVGGQFGSEGKGAVVGHIAEQFGVHVRVGAANAGHSVYVDGEKHVLQSIPCAAYCAPEAVCVLGPGALISPSILVEEINRNNAWRHERGLDRLELVIDRRAHVIKQEHIDREQQSDLAKRIGSTSTIAREGIGVATAARVMREAGCVTAKDVERDLTDSFADVYVEDSVDVLHEAMGRDTNILLEGTQGTGLSLTTGDFPFLTSRNTTATGLAADCGLGPRHIDEVIAVLRTFPIRVAGNSGPFYPDSQETDFRKIGVQEERTTVTKLVRRIATFSMMQARDAVWLNSATRLALTFGDYIAPSLAGVSEFDEDAWQAPDVRDLFGLVASIEQITGTSIQWIGTGPDSIIDRNAVIQSRIDAMAAAD